MPTILTRAFSIFHFSFSPEIMLSQEVMLSPEIMLSPEGRLAPALHTFSMSIESLLPGSSYSL